MEMRKTRYWPLFILTASFVIMYIHPVYAKDELLLTGIIKSIDYNTKTVVVDVQSSSCHGLRVFTVDNPAALEDSVNKKIDFPIDSSTCKSGEVHKMFPGRREEK